MHIYGSRADHYSLAKIKFKNGLFDKITVEEREDFAPLDDIDINKMKLLIVNHLDEVLKRWIDYYLYNKEVREEIITKRIENSPFS